jgi:hypothetical protein
VLTTVELIVTPLLIVTFPAAFKLKSLQLTPIIESCPTDTGEQVAAEAVFATRIRHTNNIKETKQTCDLQDNGVFNRCLFMNTLLRGLWCVEIAPINGAPSVDSRSSLFKTHHESLVMNTVSFHTLNKGVADYAQFASTYGLVKPFDLLSSRFR